MKSLNRLRGKLSLPIWAPDAVELLWELLLFSLVGALALNEVMSWLFPGMDLPLPTVSEILAPLGI